MAITEPADPLLPSLHQAVTNIQTVLKASIAQEANLTQMDERLSRSHHALSDVSSTAAQLQSLSMATTALDSRLNRAVSPALHLLHSFRRAESIQRRLLALSTSLSSPKAASSPGRRLRLLLRYCRSINLHNI